MLMSSRCQHSFYCVTLLGTALDHLHSAKLILKSEATLKITSVNSATPHNAKFPHRGIILPGKRDRGGQFTHFSSQLKKKSKESNWTCPIPAQHAFKKSHQILDSKKVNGEGDGGEILWVECFHCFLWFTFLCIEETDCSDDVTCAECKRQQ